MQDARLVSHILRRISCYIRIYIVKASVNLRPDIIVNFSKIKPDLLLDDLERNRLFNT